MEREVTKRELIFSAVILSVMIVLGILIYGNIKEYETDRNAIYNKAVKFEDSDLFKYGMRTNVGNAFISGELKAVDPVTFDEVDGRYLSIKKVEERYNRHTRTVTSTTVVNGKPKTTTRTEVYYSWDYAGKEERNATKVLFNDIEFDASKFDLPGYMHIDTQKVSSHVRYVYEGVPSEMIGSVFTKLENNTISDDTTFYKDTTIEDLYGYLSVDIYGGIFIVAWTILTGIILFVFFYAENKWLE